MPAIRVSTACAILLVASGAVSARAQQDAPAQEPAAQAPTEELPPALDRDLDPELYGAAAPSAPDEPARVVATLGGGVSLRLGADDEFHQDLLAPFYLEAFGAYVFPGSGTWRHGVGLGAALNLTDDSVRGGDLQHLGADGKPLTERFGPRAGEQVVLTPTYLAYFRPFESAVPDLSVFAKVGIPLAVTPEFSPGLEVGAGGAYMLTAGLGVYLEIDVSAFLGAQGRGGDITIHPLASADVGLLIDWEVLP